MEEVTLTQEQLDSLTATADEATGGGNGDVYYTYLSADDATGAQPVAPAQDGASVIVGGGASEVESANQQQQQLLINQTDGQEIFVLDQETGEYQKCVYIQQPGGPEGEETAVLQEGEEQQQEEVDLQSLLDSGGISAEDFAAAINAASVNEEGEGGEQVIRYVIQEQAEEQQQQQPVQEQPAAHLTATVGGTSKKRPRVPAIDGDGAPVSLAGGGSVRTLHSQRILVQCGKCSRTFDAEDFEAHFDEVHSGRDAFAESASKTKTCSICSKRLTKKDYLTHFKESHSDVRLGCPKCPQTYHSPELLNVHYKHFHLKGQPTDENVEIQPEDALGTALSADSLSAAAEDDSAVDENGRTTLRNVRLLIKCRVCQVLVTNLNQHMMLKHPSEPRNLHHEQLAIVTEEQASQRIKMFSLHCEICLKSFETQKDFANHRRRKDFCVKPRGNPEPEVPQKRRRRVGIIRRSL